MDDVLHFPTCKVWETNDAGVCNCNPKTDWQILMDPTQQFPWRVFRKTKDGSLQPLMGCSSYDGALSLVDSFAWLKDNGRELRWRGGNV